MGRKRLDATADPEIVVALEGSTPPQTVRFQNGAWQNRDACPSIHIYDDRFVAENVLIGHHINLDQRRNLYGLVIGDRAIALKEAVDVAEQNLSSATTKFNTTRDNLSRLLPEGLTIETFKTVSRIDDIDQKIETATEELLSAQKTTGIAEAIRQRRSLSPIPVAKISDDIETILTATLDDVALVAEKKIREHLARTSNGLSIDWLNQGHLGKGEKCNDADRR